MMIVMLIMMIIMIMMMIIIVIHNSLTHVFFESGEERSSTNQPYLDKPCLRQQTYIQLFQYSSKHPHPCCTMLCYSILQYITLYYHYQSVVECIILQSILCYSITCYYCIIILYHIISYYILLYYDIIILHYIL